MGWAVVCRETSPRDDRNGGSLVQSHYERHSSIIFFLKRCACGATQALLGRLCVECLRTDACVAMLYAIITNQMINTCDANSFSSFAEFGSS